jgi:NADPH-dependent 2,4-dienoyl-CoA reductase/sulfur reductase-like enzyme/pSer/pThr/pTyr-binding forkhead associated (FHA) protein/CRP-like cAMP-binding protein/Fe-S-cluster-containing hydrogenase component 2
VGKQLSYLIVGNGITGVTAAEVLRAEDKTCAITIVADDPYPVYYRPALKDYLGGRMEEEKLWARPHTFYQEQRVRFVSGRVATIHPLQHTVQLHNGQQLSYHKLLLANGARARTLACPGLNLAGVTTLRTIADYQQVLHRLGNLSNTERIVVCGSGTLALESAETLRHLGYQITHLLRNRLLWSEVLDSTASDMVLQEEQRAGIDVHLEEEIAEIIGHNGQVKEVVTTRGAHMPCDLVLIAIGIEPLIDFIQASGIACGRGVKVDETMRTNAPDVYAAGDVIEITDALTGKTRVLGQWYPAIQQARIAAHAMRDATYVPDDGAFYNATFLYGLDFVSIGLTANLPQGQFLHELVAPPQPRSYRKLLLQNGIPLGALFLGNRAHALAFKRAIDHHVNLTPILNSVFDEDFQLDEWLDAQQVPPVIAPQKVSNSTKHAVYNLPTLAGVVSSAYEAFLVPVAHPQLATPLDEVPLNMFDREQPITIGRQADATLLIEHNTVSRRHAEIRYVQDQYVLRDVASSYGTLVNGHKLDKTDTHVLRPNDLLRFGDLQFRFQLRPTTSGELPTTALTTNLTSTHDSLLQADTSPRLTSSLLSTVGDAPTLIITAQSATPKVVPLTFGQRMTIGRDTTNDLPIDDAACSRRHAELFTASDGFYIRDLNSSNGVFVNKVKITNPYHLSHGDRIVLGNVLLYFSYAQPQAAQAPLVKQLDSKKHLSFEGQKSKEVVFTAGMAHRTQTQALRKEHVNFEIDMCIGCDRCMSACPLPISSTITIADLNHATVARQVPPHIARFTYECIMCGSCVPVCPVDNHRDLLMLSLKQRLGVSWNDAVDTQSIMQSLPAGWTLPYLLQLLRTHPLLSDTQHIPDNYLLHLFAASQLLSLSPGALVFREGSYGRDLYLILEGSLALTAIEVDEKELLVAIIQRGEYVGDYGMLTGQPYTESARAQTQTLLLQIPEQVMQRFMELVPPVRAHVDRLHATRSIPAILKRLALFQGIADADIQALAAQAQIKRYDRNEQLFGENAAAGEHPARETLHVILEGFVKVARHTSASMGHDKTNERIIAYRQGGDYFAGGLDLLGDGRAVTVTSINRTRIAVIPRPVMLALFQKYPEVNQRFSLRLREYIESSASADSGIFEDMRTKNLIDLDAVSAPATRAGLHSIVSDGVVEGTEVLIIDLDKCIHCNECEEACARRHGHSRMNRKGMVVGNISIATACRQCQDPVCMLCSRAGIARLPDGEVYITETCIGCGICAERCPYDAISIVDVAETEEPIGRSSWQQFSQFFKTGITKESKRKPLPMAVSGKLAAPSPLDVALPQLAQDSYAEMRKKIAIKCDLCAGYKDQACVEACPMGAALRVQPTVFFGSTEEILRRRA